MDIRKLQKIVVAAPGDQGQDIEVINTTKLTALFDRIVIASGDSNRQTRALANNVQEKVKEAGGEVLSVEGDETGEWVLVDLGSMVMHRCFRRFASTTTSRSCGPPPGEAPQALRQHADSATE